MALQANSSESEDERGGESDEDIAMLAKKFKEFLRNKKRNFKRKHPKGKHQAKGKSGEITCYECGKPRHIKWECPNLKITREKKEENAEVKKECRGKKQRAFWLNSNSESSSDDEKKEVVNRCLMAGSTSSDSEKDEVCSPTYDELISYVDELYESLEINFFKEKLHYT